MHDLAPVIRDLAVILTVASIVIIIFHKIRQPIVLGYLIAGIIIGPYTPPHSLITDVADVQALSELGVIFLMFSLGLDFSFHKLKKVGFSASITGVVEVVFMLALGFIVAKLIGWSFNDAIFLGAALAISSTTIIIKALDELNLKAKHFAKIVFGVLVVEDLLAILLLAFLSTAVISNNFQPTHIFWSAVKLVAIVGSWFLLGYFLVPPLFRRIMRYANKETLTIVSVALCLLLVGVAAYFDYSVALGAFIMGSILAETDLLQRIEEVVQPMRDIFAAVFFVSVGMLIQPKVIFDHFTLILVISAITIGGKLITTSIGAFLTGQSVNNSLRIGFSLAQIGEFSFIIIGLGAALHAISDQLFPIIVAVSAITTFTTPYLIKFSGLLSSRFEEQLNPKTKLFLSSYSSWIYRLLSRSDDQPIFRRVSIRLLINGIIVAIIFNLIEHFVLPGLTAITTRPAFIKVFAWILALTISSPFIWGMLSAFQLTHQTPNHVLSRSRATLFVTWLITIIEIAFLSLEYFDTMIVGLILAVITVIYFIYLYKHLERTYKWFEKQLLRNVKMKDEKEETYDELAPWDTYLIELEVSKWSPMVNKTLGELALRETYGINIIAIYRGLDLIFAPDRSQTIFPLDKLVILGSDEQIDNFKKAYLEGIHEAEETPLLEGFGLHKLLLRADHPYVGKTIQEVDVRKLVNGFVVGLERGEEKILNPGLNTSLRPNDLLFIVGEKSRFQTI